MGRRPPVALLSGEAPEAMRGIEDDFTMLEAARTDVRVWTCAGHAVVLGISRDENTEVDAGECARRGVAVLRRASGGGTVVIGAGTIQYAIVLRHEDPEPPSISESKRRSNDLVRAALAEAGIRVDLEHDVSGDLRLGDRKVGGLALRRHRDATLVHGTLLASADLDLLAAVLRHPASEPEWRRGRLHADFLANLGAFDRDAFARGLRQSLGLAAAIGRAPSQP